MKGDNQRTCRYIEQLNESIKVGDRSSMHFIRVERKMLRENFSPRKHSGNTCRRGNHLNILFWGF